MIPFLPLFDLLRIHPLAIEYGVGPFTESADLTGHGSDALEQGLDRYIATQIAYGRAGRIVGTRVSRRSCSRVVLLHDAGLAKALPFAGA